MDFIQLEEDILMQVQELHNPILDTIMKFITKLGDKGFIWICIAAILVCKKKYRKSGFCILVSLLTTALLGNVVLKNVIARERPCWGDSTIPLLISNPTDYSFPSGHTMASFAAATAIFLKYKRAGVIAYLLATGIAFSRVYCYVHYPSDVIVGMLVGITVAILCCKMMEEGKSSKFL